MLDMYLDQPFDEYCITRKELLDLLRRHHNTAIELEKEKEEKQRWVSSLSSTLLVGFFTSTDFRTFWMPRSPSSRGESSQMMQSSCVTFHFRFKQSVRKMFSRYPTARPSTSSGSSDSHTPSDDPLLDTSVGYNFTLSPSPTHPHKHTHTHHTYSLTHTHTHQHTH